MNDKTIVPLSWDIIGKDIVEFGYTDDINNTLEADFISEITAVFTTANARIKLYAMLEFLGPDQVLYCDTDSCYFIYDPENPNHKKPTNDQALPATISFAPKKKACLGQWESDLKDDEYIIEFVCGGAKSYAYRTNKSDFKIKQEGSTLDFANDKILAFDAFKNTVLNNESLNAAEGFKFKTQREIHPFLQSMFQEPCDQLWVKRDRPLRMRLWTLVMVFETCWVYSEWRLSSNKCKLSLKRVVK